MCVDNFRNSPDAAANLVSLTKLDNWSRHTFIEKGGWATLGESTEPDPAVARACATILVGDRDPGGPGEFPDRMGSTTRSREERPLALISASGRYV